MPNTPHTALPPGHNHIWSACAYYLAMCPLWSGYKVTTKTRGEGGGKEARYTAILGNKSVRKNILQISPCSTFCTLCGPVPRRILRIRSAAIQENLFYPFCRANGAVLPLPPRSCCYLVIKMLLLQVTTHTHTVHGAALNALG